jgi:FtsH-binding integral membrane protein
MVERNQSAVRSPGRSKTRDIDVGLRNYMLKIYNYMGVGLALTCVIAYMVSNNASLMHTLTQTGFYWILLIAQLGLVFFLSFRVTKMSAATAQLTFWAYAALTGVTFSVLFMVYTSESMTRVFFITAGTFGAMSVWGYTTKRDLTAMGSFLIMGLIGLIIASIVNLFLHSSALMFITSALGVLIFVGLTAYDTQKIKQMYYQVGQTALSENFAILGALTLYLDFINLFLYLLRFLGDRR